MLLAIAGFLTPSPPATAALTLALLDDLHMTGAGCYDRMLEVSLPDRAGPAYSDWRTDRDLFYDTLRGNAVERVTAWRDAHDR